LVKRVKKSTSNWGRCNDGVSHAREKKEVIKKYLIKRGKGIDRLLEEEVEQRRKKGGSTWYQAMS